MFKEKTVFIFLHDCEDCKHINNGKCTITKQEKRFSTDCKLFEFKEEL